MTDGTSTAPETQPTLSLTARLIGLALAAVLTSLGIIFGFLQGAPVQGIILYAIATFALFFWAWRFILSQLIVPRTASQDDTAPSPFWLIWQRFRASLIGLGIILLGYAIIAASVEGFFSIWSVLSLLILLVIIIATRTIGPFFETNRSAFIGLMVLLGLFLVGAMTIDGFASAVNVKSMLLFAAFLGLAAVGQTLVALLGGLISLGVPPWLAAIIVLVIGAGLGVINGLLSFKLQGQALIITLGTGFAISGGVQIITSIGTAYGGNVFATVPQWLTNLAAMNGRTFGLPFTPVIAIWAVVALILIVGLRHTVYGRHLYALGVNRVSASRVRISELRYWVLAYALSGFFAALTGALLLGWSGGGFIGVGDQYLFLTLAAVVVGGTSLLGGQGGYGFTVIGVLVLQVLSSFLVGIGLNFQWQQVIFGLLILPMAALYARSPHIRTQI
jgi:ribose transport system permease protein